MTTDPRGCSVANWQTFALEEDEPARFVLVADLQPPLDAMRYTYLEAQIDGESGGEARLAWENAEGERCTGTSISTSDNPIRLYLRNNPAWRGLQFRLFLDSPRPIEVIRFTLFGEKDLTTLEKLCWPSDFAIVPRRRVVAAGEPVEARLIVPNRLLRALGENHVVFTVTDSRGHVLAEKRISGRQPQDTCGATDFFSGSMGEVHVTGPLRLHGRALGAATQEMLEDSVSLTATGERAIPVFAEPYHYLRDFAVIRHDGQFHLLYTVGQADAKQADDAPRAARELGHATSVDLCQWTIQARALTVERGDDDEVAIRAPALIRTGDGFDMFYTATNAAGAESIRRAQSPDLNTWTREPSFAYTPNPAWADWSPDLPCPCRNASIVQHGDVWILLYNSVHRDGRYCVAAAVSADLAGWADAGPILLGDRSLGSPACVAHGAGYLMYTDSALFQSDDPLRNWAPVRDSRPAGWRGWEFLAASEEKWAVAYRDLTKGNFVQAFPLAVRGAWETPEIDFSEVVSIEEAG